LKGARIHERPFKEINKRKKCDGRDGTLTAAATAGAGENFATNQKESLHGFRVNADAGSVGASAGSAL